jgi:hypothetical protein
MRWGRSEIVLLSFERLIGFSGLVPNFPEKNFYNRLSHMDYLIIAKYIPIIPIIIIVVYQVNFVFYERSPIIRKLEQAIKGYSNCFNSH